MLYAYRITGTSQTAGQSPGQERPARTVHRLYGPEPHRRVLHMKDRFEVVDREGFSAGTRIIVDTETGVQYVLAWWMNVGGVTVLLDQDGKPLLDPRYARK